MSTLKGGPKGCASASVITSKTSTKGAGDQQENFGFDFIDIYSVVFQGIILKTGTNCGSVFVCRSSILMPGGGHSLKSTLATTRLKGGKLDTQSFE